MKNKIKHIIHLLETSKDNQKIKEKLTEFHPADLSQYFHEFSYEDRIKIYKLLDDHELALLFSYFENPKKYLDELEVQDITQIFEQMEVDDINSILTEIDDPYTILKYTENLSEEVKADLDYISKIKEDKVGRIMSTNYISVESGVDVKQAMKKLISEASEQEFIDPIFVLEDGNLIGTLSINDLIIARSPKNINDIMNSNPVSVNINESISEVVKIIRNYALDVLPVVDDNKLVGIITSDDAFEISSTLHDVKYANLAGVSTDNIEDKRFFKRLFERLPWLIALAAISLLTTNLMGVYEGIIQQVTILVFFQTLILDMAGNVGTQSLAVTLQQLIHNDKMTSKEERKHIQRELNINLINALFLMVIAFIVCYIFINIYGSPYSSATIALIIALSMGITLLVSAFFGAFLPIVLTKLKVNPSAASGPLITTINDIISILVYFNLAALFLGLAI